MFKNKLIVLLILVSLISMCLTSCSDGSSVGSSFAESFESENDFNSNNTETLKVATSSFIGCFNPFFAFDANDINVVKITTVK